MHGKRQWLVGIPLCLAGVTALARGEVAVPSIFSDHMVLQRDVPLPVWGWAAPGEKVTVRLAGQQKTATADDQGRWSLTLQPLPAGGPHEMTVAAANPIVIQDILVGEVWLCSGQSNMQFPVSRADNGSEEVAAARFPGIRQSLVRFNADAAKPRDNVTAEWAVCSPETAPRFSAVAYFFGRELHKALNVPIGLVNASVGATPIEAWISRPALDALPAARFCLDTYQAALRVLPEKNTEYRRRLAEWQKQADQAKAENQPPPRPPSQPLGPKHKHAPAALFNGMIHPLVPFALRGVIWYQGESNADRSEDYEPLLAGMIADWRRAWKAADLPFGIVQLPNYHRPHTDPNEFLGWTHIREAQLHVSQNLPNVGLVVTVDVGEAADIHPPCKQPVGHRLALWALAKVYGKNVVYTGPIYQSIQVEGRAVRVRFAPAADGLEARGGELKGFALAGADKVFHWAEARIDGGTVVVSAEDVPQPVAVRYDWGRNPFGNLFSKAGLPASPFRSDDWPKPEVKK